VPDELQLQHAALRGARDAPAFGDDHPQSQRFELRQRGRQGLGVDRIDLEADDAGELAGEARHPALGPARAVGLAAIRQLADESGPVGADDGDDERREHGGANLR